MNTTVSKALDYASKVILARDYGLYQHCVNVASICHPAAEELGLDPELAYVGGLLHDCGKIVWLDDPGNWEFMDHPVLGYGLLKDIDIDVATMAYMHHSYQMNPYPRVCEIEVDDRMEPYCQLVCFADKVEASMTRSFVPAKDAVAKMKRCHLYRPEVVEAVNKVVTSKSPYRLI